MARLAELVEAHVNPLMLKETFQGFRGGSLRLLGLVALFVPLLTFGALIFSSVAEDRDVEQVGRGIFYMLSMVLCFCGLVGSMQGAQQFQAEIKSQSIDLIVLTALSPWQLAVGRFQAAAMQLCLLFGLALPFAAACVALGGVSLGYVAGTLGMLLLINLMQCSFTLAVATWMLCWKHARVLLQVAAVPQVIVFGFVVVTRFARVVPDGDEVAWVVALVVLVTLLFLRLAADMLAPIALRTFALSKACLAALLAVYFTPLWIGALAANSTSDRAWLLGVGLALLYAFALLWSGAPERPARFAAPWRWLLDDGHTATASYCALITVLVSVVAALRGWPAMLPMLCFVHFVFITGVALLGSSRGRSTEAYLFYLIAGLAFECSGSFLWWTLHTLPDTQQLVSVLKQLFPLGAPLLTSITPWSVVPAILGLAAIAWARQRHARAERG